MQQLIDVLCIIGAISWLTTAFVNKEGPFNILIKFRIIIAWITKEHTPFGCFHCASFYVGSAVLLFYYSGIPYSVEIIHWIGLLGLGWTIRGMSGDF